jgi:hypothetical protein
MLNNAPDPVETALNLARGGKVHSGAINSAVAGRTDHLPIHVPSGAYVIPADIISAMGEGNTMAGFKHAEKLFGGKPYAAGKPYEPAARAEGGGVPIVAAGGEYVIPPEAVMHIGKGDLDCGHRALDQFVLKFRAKTVKKLKALPGPQKG